LDLKLLTIGCSGLLDMIDIFNSYQSTSDTKMRQFWLLKQSGIALFFGWRIY